MDVQEEASVEEALVVAASEASAADPLVVEEQAEAGKPFYIEAMISNAPISSPVSHSVSRTSRSGHICALFRIRVIAADGMSSPVKGSAIRLVRRKY